MSGGHPAPPPATGVRLPWSAVLARVRDAVEHQLGAQVVEAVSQTGGFSPGVAARLRLAGGGRAFVSALAFDGVGWAELLAVRLAPAASHHRQGLSKGRTPRQEPGAC